MRRLPGLLLGVGLAGTASAQTFDPTLFAQIRTDSGADATAWRVQAVSGPSDWFHVNLGGLATGFVAYGVLADCVESSGMPGRWKELGFRTSNAVGDPDVSNAGRIAAQVNAPVRALDGFGDELAWSVPATTLGSDLHVTANWHHGDSSLWIVSDGRWARVTGRSAETRDGYATASIPFTVADFILGAAGFPPNTEGSLLVNGASSSAVPQNRSLCLTFTACAPGVASALFVFTPILFGPLAPIPMTVTGNRLTGGPLSNQWTICAAPDCSRPTGGPFGLGTVYLDPCDLKVNGRPRPKVSNPGTLTTTPSRTCSGCFGLKDDEGWDGTGWVVALPSGISDYFNVNHGSPLGSSNVSLISGLEILSWNNCGTSATWATVGIFPDEAARPGFPDLQNPFGVDPNPVIPPNTLDTAYPATFYDIPTFAASTTTTYHTVVRWRQAESCLFVNADTSSDSFTCTTPLGGPAATSAWTLDGYAATANYVNYANWMMQIKWN